MKALIMVLMVLAPLLLPNSGMAGSIPDAEPSCRVFLDGAELDAVAELPYTRTYHPMYEPLGGVPAIEEVRFSITHNRGCFGGCSFCALDL